METVNIFDDLDGKGLDIGHDGEYTFQNGNIIRLNIYPGENIDVVYDGIKIPFDNDIFDKILLKMTLLKYFINPLFLRSKTPNENNFSQFAYIVKKVPQT